MTLAPAEEHTARLATWGWQAGRVALALLWLGWAALAWWSAPRPAEIGVARADLDAGRVVSAVRIESWGRSPQFWGSTPQPRTHPDGATLVWETTDGRVHYTAPDLDLPLNQWRRAGGVGPGPDSAVASLARQMDARGVPRGSTAALANVAFQLAGLLAVTGFLLVCVGPRPVRGTRVFWFWVGQFPLGLGALAWLATERPWTRRHGFEPETRISGWWGFGILFVFGIVLMMVMQLLRLMVPVSILP